MPRTVGGGRCRADEASIHRLAPSPPRGNAGSDDEQMPRRTFVDQYALDALLTSRERVVTHWEFRRLGVPISTVTARIGPGGPWQRILPGVVIAHRGQPTHRERVLAALSFAGEHAILTGANALAEHRVRGVQRTSTIRVLVPHTSHRKSFWYAGVQRTRRLPEVCVRNGIRCAPVARALVDECREQDVLDDVRELVAKVIQRRGCSVRTLLAELGATARQRTALPRQVLAEVHAGIRSVAEGQARQSFCKYGVKQPLWNPSVHTLDGEFLARPDGYWDDVGAALEIDSFAWHLGPRSYLSTQRRQRNLEAHGILVLPVAPVDVIDDPRAFCAQVRDFLAQANRRTPPRFIVRPAAN